MIKISGIYKITNKKNNHCYIGSSKDIYNRWRNHKQTHNNPKRKEYGYKLYSAMRSYGIENFNFEILEECDNNQLLDRERYWYNYYKPEYNMMFPDRGPGKMKPHHSKESRQKIKEHNTKYWLGKKLPDYMIKNIIEGNKSKRIGVIMLDPITLKPLKEFDGICNALRFLGKNPNNTKGITKCCTGEYDKAYGYKWKYKNKNVL